MKCCGFLTRQSLALIASLAAMKYWLKIMLPLTIAVIFVVGFQWINGWKQKSYTLSSGNEGGGYSQLAGAIETMSKENKLGLKLTGVESQGSQQNIDRLVGGTHDFGLVQLGEDRTEGVRSVATVYREVVHILVRKDSGVDSVESLKGKKVSVGMASSGTLNLSVKLLEHYGLSEENVDMLKLSPQASLKKLVSGDIEAMILVTALRAPIVRQALATGVIEHSPLSSDKRGVAAGICSRLNYLEPSVLPRHAYAKSGEMKKALPSNDIEVLHVPTQLVCREDVPAKAVFEMTRSLFLHKRNLETEIQAVHGMNEKDINSGYTLHPGAESYYLRKAPGFLVVYAEVIALMVSLTVTLFGLITALKKWMQMRHKQRIDVYYAELNTMMQKIEQSMDDESAKPIELEAELNQIRHRAFDDLVAEKLPADESFRIFQDLLEECVDQLNVLKLKI